MYLSHPKLPKYVIGPLLPPVRNSSGSSMVSRKLFYIDPDQCPTTPLRTSAHFQGSLPLYIQACWLDCTLLTGRTSLGNKGENLRWPLGGRENAAWTDSVTQQNDGSGREQYSVVQSRPARLSHALPLVQQRQQRPAISELLILKRCERGQGRWGEGSERPSRWRCYWEGIVFRPRVEGEWTKGWGSQPAKRKVAGRSSFNRGWE
jgi:hypothetical protein